MAHFLTRVCRGEYSSFFAFFPSPKKATTSAHAHSTGLHPAEIEAGRKWVAFLDGEAAMFTALRKGKDQVPFGLNSPDAPENLQFLLNLVHWLDPKGKLK